MQALQEKLVAEAQKIQKASGNSGLTATQQEVYSTVGGTPHLDGQYTVFGEVEEGLDIVEKIQNCATGRADRPVDDVKITMELLS